MTRRVSCSQPARISPGLATYFLRFAEESRQRRATPMRSPSLRLGFPPMLAPVGTGRNALRSLRSLRLNGRPEPEVEVRCRARPQSLRFSAAHRGPRETEQLIEVRAVRLLAVGCLGGPLCQAEQRRRTGQRAQARRQNKLGAAVQAERACERSAFRAGPGLRAAQGTDRRRRAAPASGVAFLFPPFSLAKQRERGRGLGLKTPRALPQEHLPAKKA